MAWDFETDPEFQRELDWANDFVTREVAPLDAVLGSPYDVRDTERNRLVRPLQQKVRDRKLWACHLGPELGGQGYGQVKLALLNEVIGRSVYGPTVFGCQAPDSGNAEILAHYGTPEQKETYLGPLLNNEIVSCFAMTEPAVASSDATNIETRIERKGDKYVINGRKWWSSGAPDSRCKIYILMGKTDPDNESRHKQQSMILVPANTPGITIERALPVFGFDDAPHGHGEVLFDNVEVPAENILLGEGRGFEIAQGRLGPGRIHHCMRAIGQAEIALEKICDRALNRVAFGKPIAEQGVTIERIAEARIMIDQARLLTLKAADMMDKVGNKAAAGEIAMIKVAAPNMLHKVLDIAVQIHGGAGVTDDFGLSFAYGQARAMRIFDGPDEVHRNQIAKLELRKHKGNREGSARS